MEKFKALMEKKKKEGASKLEPHEAAAHGSVLGDLMNSLDSHGMEKVKGLKKVTVASNSPDGLKSGLDKAKEIVDEGSKEVKGGDEHDNDLLSTEAHDSPEYEDDNESDPDGDNSPEDHISADVANDKHSMHGFDGPDHTSHPDNHMNNMAKENEELKKEIARLRAPKPYY